MEYQKLKEILTKAGKILTIPDELVVNKIYVIRDQIVMVDNDLADLYEVEARRLKEAVRRNIDRFPDDFMIEMNQEKLDN